MPCSFGGSEAGGGDVVAVPTKCENLLADKRSTGFYKNNQVNSENFIVHGDKLPYFQDRNVGEYLLEQIDSHGQLVAQIDPLTGEFTTYNDILIQSIRCARGLRKRGITDGDVIAICSHNNLDVSLPILGGLYVGAIIAPLHPTLCRPDLKHLLSITKPKLIFCDQESIEKIRKSLEELKWAIDLVIFGETKAHTSFDSFTECCLGDETDTDLPFSFTNAYERIAFIVPTSGTHHKPRGVSISHGNLLHHLQTYWCSNWKGSALLNVSTISTIIGIKSILTCLDHGAINIIPPKFNLDNWIQIMNQWRGNMIVITTTSYYNQLINYTNIEQFNFSSVKMLLIHGKNVTDTQLKAGEKTFPAADIILGYGTTETTGMICTSVENKRLSIGIPDPDMEMKVIHEETGKTLGPNVCGEILVRGTRIMLGYYNDLAATTEAIDRDGWFHTGDIGYFDQDLCFHIKGPIQEKFVYRSCEIMPFEIEEVLLEHPEIKEVCVIGVRHPIDGARAKAFIVRQDNSTISDSRIRRYLEGRVSPSKQLHGGIIFMDKIPLTPSGKINRRRLLKLV